MYVICGCVQTYLHSLSLYYCITSRPARVIKPKRTEDVHRAPAARKPVVPASSVQYKPPRRTDVSKPPGGGAGSKKNLSPGVSGPGGRAKPGGKSGKVSCDVCMHHMCIICMA